jgi:hypothetical protein
MSSMSKVESSGGPAGVVVGQPVDAASAKWSTQPEIPPSQCGLADPVAAALATLSKLAERSRELSREMKEAQEAARATHERRQVEALRGKADEIRAGALGQAIGLAGAAALHLVAFEASRRAPSAASGDEGLAKARAAGSPGSEQKILGDAARSRDAAARADSATRLYAGLAGTLEKGAELPKAAYEAKGVELDAEALLEESRAKRASARAEQLGDDVQQATEVARKAWDAIRAVHETRHAAQMAILGTRG